MNINLDSDSIREILTEIGYSLSDQGKYFRTKPIYRDSSSNTVLSIRKSDGKWKDFREGIGGSFEDLIRLSLSLKSKVATTKWLINKGVDITSEAKNIEPKIPQAKVFENENLTKLIPDHSYWNNRGISKETLSTFKGGVIDSGKMAERYVFPIFNKQSK